MIVNNLKKLKKSLKSNNLSIYLFHGVIKKRIKKNSIRNYNLKHINVIKFEKYLKFLSNNGEAITLDDINNKNQKFKNKYVVTFDDGFFNNLKYAFPILKKYNIPHIIYLTTNYVDKNLISWIDRIDIAIDSCKEKQIYSNIFKKKFKLGSKKNKIIFLNFIRKKFKILKKKDLNSFAEKLLKDLNLKSPLSSQSDLDKKLSWKNVIQMSNNNLTEFGGHSHNHNILGHLSKQQYVNEINKSLNFLKKKVKLILSITRIPKVLRHLLTQILLNYLKKKI